MTSIREELLEATGVKPKKDDTNPKLIKRVIKKAEGLDDSGWESLSTEAQEFYNLVIETARQHADGNVLDLSDENVPPFPDEQEEPEDEEEESDEEPEEEGEEVMTQTNTVKKAVTKKVAAQKKAVVASNGGEKKPMSMSRRLRQLIIKKPALDVDALIEKLNGEGYKASKLTVGTFRADTRSTLKVLVELGMLNIEL